MISKEKMKEERDCVYFICFFVIFLIIIIIIIIILCFPLDLKKKVKTIFIYSLEVVLYLTLFLKIILGEKNAK